MEITRFLFIVDVIVIMLSFVFYRQVLVFLINLLEKKKPAKKHQEPELTAIIPAHNEENNIEKKLVNLVDSGYQKKKLNIIVTDDFSTDKTAEIVKNFEKFPVVLIKAKEYKGKIAAINNALKHSKTEIVILSDADATLEKGAIKNLVSYFSSNKIGGVTGNIIIDIKSSFYSSGQKKFQNDENKLRNYESTLDSVSSMDGRLCAFRKSIVKNIDKDAAADDLEMTYQIRKKGHKVVFAQDAIVHEKAPTNLSAEFQQKRRRSLYTINVVFRHIDMLFNPKYGPFGIFIFPFRRFFGILSPFLLLFAFFYLLKLKYFILLLMLIVILLLCFNYTRGIMVYYLLVIVSILMSWLDFLVNGFKAKGKWRRHY